MIADSLKHNLERVLGEWQKMFRMQDWHIDLLFVDRRDQNTYELGVTCISETHRNAKITILNPEQVHKDDESIADPLNTLAHEFAHVLTWSRPRTGQDTIERVLYEQEMENFAAGIEYLTKEAGLWP